MVDSRETALRAAYAACKAAETAWGGPVRSPSDCRAKEELNASASEIGEAMLLLKRAGARFGFGIGPSVLPREGRSRIFQHHDGCAIDKQGRAFVAVFADGSESAPLPNKTAAIAMLPPGVRYWASERTKGVR